MLKKLLAIIIIFTLMLGNTMFMPQLGNGIPEIFEKTFGASNITGYFYISDVDIVDKTISSFSTRTNHTVYNISTKTTTTLSTSYVLDIGTAFVDMHELDYAYQGYWYNVMGDHEPTSSGYSGSTYIQEDVWHGGGLPLSDAYTIRSGNGTLSNPYRLSDSVAIFNFTGYFYNAGADISDKTISSFSTRTNHAVYHIGTQNATTLSTSYVLDIGTAFVDMHELDYAYKGYWYNVLGEYEPTSSGYSGSTYIQEDVWHGGGLTYDTSYSIRSGSGTLSNPYRVWSGADTSTPPPTTPPPTNVSGSTTYKPSISTSNPVEDSYMTIGNAKASGYTKYLYVGRNGSFSYEKSFTGTSTTYTPSASDVGKTLTFYFYYYDSSSGYTGYTMDSDTTNAVQAATIALVAPGYAPTGSTIPGYTLTAPTITGTYSLRWYR
ncbi:MAG: hypothetical protein LBL34_05890, partial [Clostridiales bacterium]|nr:hypothetical protein [Clostridiales bacterium]